VALLPELPLMPVVTPLPELPLMPVLAPLPELPLMPVVAPVAPDPEVSAEVVPDAPVPDAPTPEVPLMPVVEPLLVPEAVVPVLDDPAPEASAEGVPEALVPELPVVPLDPFVDPVEPVPVPELARVLDAVPPVFDPVLVEPVAELDKPPPAPIEVSSMLRRDRQSALAGVMKVAKASKAVV